MSASTTVAPDSKLYRTAKANDAGPFNDKKQGLNCGHYENLHLEILPSGGDNPVIEVLYWSEEAGLFIGENPAAPYAARGANVPWTVAVPVRGRHVMVVVNSGGGVGETKIATSGYGIDHTL